jgi:hypothetical protein
MVKKVGADQVILFSLPVKKLEAEGMDWNLPGPDRIFAVTGNRSCRILSRFRKMRDSL